MNAARCPNCGRSGHVVFSTTDGAVFESCRSCGFARRVTPLRRELPAPNMVIAVCTNPACGDEFSYEKGLTAKRLRGYCPPCRHKRYNPEGRRAFKTPFGPVRVRRAS